MAAVISEHNPCVILLNELTDFQGHALKAVRDGRRQLCMLSETLDAAVYDTDEFRDAIRIFITRDRYAQARFLVKDTRPMTEHGHRLLQLARRLGERIEIRRLTISPQNNNHAWLIVDDATLLYKHDESTYQGYFDHAATSKCRLLLEEFNHLWDLYGEEDPNLREQVL